MFSGIHENNDGRDQPYLCITTIESVKALLSFQGREYKCDSVYFLAFGQKHKVKTFPWQLFVTMVTKSPLYHYYVPVDGGEVLTVRRQVLR